MFTWPSRQELLFCSSGFSYISADASESMITVGRSDGHSDQVTLLPPSLSLLGGDVSRGNYCTFNCTLCAWFLEPAESNSSHSSNHFAVCNEDWGHWWCDVHLKKSSGCLRDGETWGYACEKRERRWPASSAERCDTTLHKRNWFHVFLLFSSFKCRNHLITHGWALYSYICENSDKFTLYSNSPFSLAL